MQTSTDDFLARFGDATDDRVDEVITEILAERYAEAGRRRSPLLALAVLLIALVASAVLRHSVLAVCAVWLSTATIYVAATLIARRGRS